VGKIGFKIGFRCAYCIVPKKSFFYFGIGFNIPLVLSVYFCLNFINLQSFSLSYFKSAFYFLSVIISGSFPSTPFSWSPFLIKECALIRILNFLKKEKMRLLWIWKTTTFMAPNFLSACLLFVFCLSDCILSVCISVWLFYVCFRRVCSSVYVSIVYLSSVCQSICL